MLGSSSQLVATVDQAEIRAVPSGPGALGVAQLFYTWRRDPVPTEQTDQGRPIVFRDLGNGEAVIMTFYTENGALVNRQSSICWQVAWDANFQEPAQR